MANLVIVPKLVNRAIRVSSTLIYMRRQNCTHGGVRSAGRILLIIPMFRMHTQIVYLDDQCQFICAEHSTGSRNNHICRSRWRLYQVSYHLSQKSVLSEERSGSWLLPLEIVFRLMRECIAVRRSRDKEYLRSLGST